MFSELCIPPIMSFETCFLSTYSANMFHTSQVYLERTILITKPCSATHHRPKIRSLLQHLRSFRSCPYKFSSSCFRLHSKWQFVLFLRTSAIFDRSYPSRLYCPLWLFGASVEKHRCGLRPHGLRSHLFPFSGIRHHNWDILLWRHRSSRCLRRVLQNLYSHLVSVHLRASIYAVSNRH